MSLCCICQRRPATVLIANRTCFDDRGQPNGSRQWACDACANLPLFAQEEIAAPVDRGNPMLADALTREIKFGRTVAGGVRGPLFDDQLTLEDPK